MVKHIARVKLERRKRRREGQRERVNSAVAKVLNWWLIVLSGPGVVGVGERLSGSVSGR